MTIMEMTTMITSDAFVNITKCVIVLLGTIITYIVVPYIKTKTTEKQRDNIYFWVQVAVNAAEQIYAEKGMGVVKKKYVVEYLRNKGINISEEDLNILIEAAVRELNLLQVAW